jgi:hypothetical protein
VLAFQNLSKLGILTSADTTNWLAVKSNAILFSHDDVTPGKGNLRVTLADESPQIRCPLMFHDCRWIAARRWRRPVHSEAQTALCSFTCQIVSSVSFFDHRIGSNAEQATASVPTEAVVVVQPGRIGSSIHTWTPENRCTINARVGFQPLPLPRDVSAKCGGCRHQKRFKIRRLRVPY